MAWRTSLVVVCTAILLLYVRPATRRLFHDVQSQVDVIHTWAIRTWDERQRSSRFWQPGDACPTEIHGITTSLRSEDGICGDPAGNFGSMKNVHKALIECDTIHSVFLRVRSRAYSARPDRFSLPFNPGGGERYLSVP